MGVLDAYNNMQMKSAQVDLIREQTHTQQEIQNEKRLQNIIKGITADWWQRNKAQTRQTGRGFYSFYKNKIKIDIPLTCRNGGCPDELN